MTLWLRIFGKNETTPDLPAFVAVLKNLAPAATVNVEPSPPGWQRAEIRLAAAETPIYIERHLRTDEGIRGELQAWAAYLETCDYSPNHPALMEHMMQTRQVFTLRKPLDAANEILVENVYVALCRHLAQATDGVYQIDGAGFFAVDGTMILQEY